jgi:hypothetical protein
MAKAVCCRFLLCFEISERACGITVLLNTLVVEGPVLLLCRSRNCSNGVCVEAASCYNLVQDGIETGQH